MSGGGNNKALVFLADGDRAIEKASTVHELKTLRDKAEAARQYAKQVGMALPLQNKIARFKIRAERKAGALLKATEADGTRQRRGNQKFQRGTSQLKDLGIEKKQSHRWQAEASVPEAEFERFCAEKTEKSEELTSAGLRKLVKDKDREKRLKEIKLRGESETLENPDDVLPNLALGAGRFRCVYLDPPWKYDTAG